MPVLSPVASFLRQEASGAIIVTIHVIANASRTQADGLHDGALRVRLHAPPVDGKANEALATWLAATLGLRRSAVELVHGQTARRKQVRIHADAVVGARWDALMSPFHGDYTLKNPSFTE